MTNSGKDQIRKLSAILFADIVGYTALMQSDEARALSSLNKFKAELEVQVPAHQGEILQFYGDGCLAVFDSSVDAVGCAKKIQGTFQTDPKVPVRIGLHVGDVVFREGNVFGDAVNVASRIESMAVAGSVLFSNNIRQQIKNQTEFEISPLGSFEFKNVEEPMGVYALSNEGLVVPRAEEIQGKINMPAPAQKKNQWLQPVLIAVLSFLLIAFAFGLWKSNAPPPGSTAVESPISEENRQKRLAVMNFENLTSDPSRDVFGQMISDWVTKGLMETGEANIINAANIRKEIAQASLGQAANPKFAEATGVDVLLQGRYYIVEGQMIIAADITEVKTGELLHSLQLKKAPEANMELLDDLTQEVINYWAVKEKKRFLQNPPKYEAYQEWMEAERLYTSEPEQSAVHLQKAFELDTTFFAPLLSLASLQARYGRTKEIGEIMAFLERHQDAFSRWEKLKFASQKASGRRDYLEAAKLNEQLAEMDPSDDKSNYSAAYFYNNANYPRKALELLQKQDPRYNSEGAYAISWRSSQEAYAQLRLADYTSIIKLAEDYPSPKMFTPLAVFHLKALVRLDSVQALARTFQHYKENGVYGPTGQPDLPDHILVVLCNELMIIDNQELLKQYAEELKEWLEQNKVVNFPHHLPDVFNNRPMRQSEAKGFAYYYLQDYQQALDAWTQEEIPETNWPDRIERSSRVGVCHALLGEAEKAQAQLDEINNAFNEHPWFEANRDYYSSRIHAALGQQDEAVAAVRSALKKGFIFFRPAVLDRDPFLNALSDYAPFVELLAPKS